MNIMHAKINIQIAKNCTYPLIISKGLNASNFSVIDVTLDSFCVIFKNTLSAKLSNHNETTIKKTIHLKLLMNFLMTLLASSLEPGN